jgi:hypothetical protein
MRSNKHQKKQKLDKNKKGGATSAFGSSQKPGKKG